MAKEAGIFFFIGTEAELIKVFPVMRAVKKRGLDFRIISSGQNNIRKSRIFSLAECGKIDLELSKEPPKHKNAMGLLQWLVRTYAGAAVKIRRAFPDTDFSGSLLIVHGDTVSTLMGAELGHHLGMKICHIEAGLRSHHLLEPFPEEIDRLLTGRRALIHFAPGKEAKDNLKKARGKVYDTGCNTLADSLMYSRTIPAGAETEKILKEDYFVFVMHRQENLVNRRFVTAVTDEILSVAKERKCVLILHEITEEAFRNFGLLEQLKGNAQFILTPRLDYFEFMKVLDGARFVITDGGSNQEELYYLGKPCLILRKRSERKEGLGKNAVLFRGDVREIGRFAERYSEYSDSGFVMKRSPSEKIAKVIAGYMHRKAYR